MIKQQTDALGRATFRHIPHRTSVKPTEREVRWLKHIERHGPQSSEFLFEATRDTHRCKDTALRDMQKLRAGGFLRLPPQQRAIERAEFQPYIYDLTACAKDHLVDLGIAEATVRPTGHWWHAYAVSAFTSTLEICTTRHNRAYVPAHRILERNGSELAIPLGGRRLIPDQLFAIRYNEGYRAYMLEVDRSTEPLSSSASRKSLLRSVDQYTDAFRRHLPRQHYGLKANTVAIWLFTKAARMAAFQKIVLDRTGAFSGHFLSKVSSESLRWSNLENLHKGTWRSGEGFELRGL